MLVLLIVLTGLMAGIYFSFSVFVIQSLNELPALQAAQAMNKINDVIVKTLFLPVFFGSTLWYAGLIVWSCADWQGQRSILMIMAAITYIFGMFVVTVFGNVPLNNQLKDSAGNDTNLAAYWHEYQRRWSRLNHIRTLSCTVSCAILVLALT